MSLHTFRHAQAQAAAGTCHAAQVQWLLGLAQQPCSLSGSFADPEQLCKAVINDVHAAGLVDQQLTEADIRPGWGGAVCCLLSRLADAALEQDATAWKRPVHRADV